ncbi:hypothetical protein OG914_26740 [Streptomyces sp. NBC_00291]|nr:hypothetical protein [Streptomyces sp. NBC_00291]MCX5157587.1 hypothetical protein [Streptomyces sp. NBC_00291]
MAYPAWITRIRDPSQPLQQAGDLLGYDLRVLAELVKSRRDQ